MKAKKEALKKAKLHKVHHSKEYCSKCGEMTSMSTRHESGHREYHHDRKDSELAKPIY